MGKEKREIQLESLEEIVDLVKQEDQDFIFHVFFGEEIQSGKQ